MRFHWQNLNEDRCGNVRGWPRSGRAWLSLLGFALRFEWHLWSRFCGASFSISGEEGLGLHAALPPVSLWFHVKRGWSFRGAREVSVSVHSAAVWWSIWRDPMAGWDSRVPRWRQGSWHPLDTFLGRTKYTEGEAKILPVLIPMPEGAYAATLKMHVDTWKRPRWFAKRISRATIDVPQGIPSEGKGENPWDCGEDRAYGITCMAETPEAGIAALVQSVLRSRRRYNGNLMAHYPSPEEQAAAAQRKERR